MVSIVTIRTSLQFTITQNQNITNLINFKLSAESPEEAKVHTSYTSVEAQILVHKKVKVEVLTQHLYSSQSNRVQAVKCTQSIKVKSFPLKDISVQS